MDANVTVDTPPLCIGEVSFGHRSLVVCQLLLKDYREEKHSIFLTVLRQVLFFRRHSSQCSILQTKGLLCKMNALFCSPSFSSFKVEAFFQQRQ